MVKIHGRQRRARIVYLSLFLWRKMNEIGTTIEGFYGYGSNRRCGSLQRV